MTYADFPEYRESTESVWLGSWETYKRHRPAKRKWKDKIMGWFKHKKDTAMPKKEPNPWIIAETGERHWEPTSPSDIWVYLTQIFIEKNESILGFPDDTLYRVFNYGFEWDICIGSGKSYGWIQFENGKWAKIVDGLGCKIWEEPK